MGLMLLIHFIFMQKKMAGNNGRINNVEIMVTLKYFSNFWRTLEMSLINYEVNFNLVSKLCYNLYWCCKSKSFIYNKWKKALCSSSYQLKMQSAKLLPQLKSGFRRTINWNKYVTKQELLAKNPNLNYLVEPSFQGVNRLFNLTFEKMHKE